MKDDEFDALLRDASSTYNEPPEPPREAMWAAISRARDAGAVVPIASVRRVPRWLSTGAAAAAVLLLGISIGRFTSESEKPATTVARAPRTEVPVPDSQVATTDSAQPSNDAVIESSEPSQSSAGNRLVAGRRAPMTPAQQRGARIERDNAAIDATSYRFAVVEHLTRTEVLLTGFRAQSRTAEGAQLDAQFASLARELLGTTRLLLATRRADDPALTRLLEDLELVLMQVSQYARDGRRGDLDAINQSLDKRNVLPKLRSTIPAGVSASAGT